MVNPLDQSWNSRTISSSWRPRAPHATLTRPIQYGTTLVLVALTFLLNLAAITLRVRYRRGLEAR